MIVFCKDCGKSTVQVYHYEEGISNTYFWCKNCFWMSRPKKIIYFDDNKETKSKDNQKNDSKKVKNNNFTKSKYTKVYGCIQKNTKYTSNNKSNKGRNKTNELYKKTFN